MKIGHGDLIDMLAKRYPPPAFSFLRNVANATGFGATRAADGLAMGLWPSRGLELHGFECKVSRRDWLRELKDPAKADEIARYCDRWWIVVSDEDIVADGELPRPWGLIVATTKGKGLRAKVEAPKLHPRGPKAVDRHFLAAVLRRVSEQHAPEAEIARAEERGRQLGREAAETSTNIDAERAKRQFEQLEESVRDFQEASGIKISQWNGKAVGESVAAITRLRDRDLRMSVERARNTFTSVIEAIDCVLASDLAATLNQPKG